MSESKKGSSATLNLDLSGITDPEQLATAIEQFYKNDSAVKTQLAYNWERTQLMLDGKQWIVYDKDGASGGSWKPLKVSRENEYIPRPVTNLMFDAYQTLKGYLLKTKPRITVRPNSPTNKDKSAAKLATLVSESNYERLQEDQNYEYAASVLIGYGTVFKKSFWDTSAGGQIEVPRVQLVPQTDPMTGAVIGETEAPALDDAGQPIVDLLPIGDVNTEVVEPYRIALDPLAADLHKARWIMEYSIQSLDWITEMYGKQEDGYTGKVAELKPETSLNSSMSRFANLKTSSGVKGGMLNVEPGGSSFDALGDNSAVLKEYYEAPSQAWPTGRLVAVANGLCLFDGPSPCEGPDLGDWHPYSECRWEIMPGRFWGKGALDDGAEIQKRVNSIDATVILTRKTMAIPQWLIPLGQGVEPGRTSGRPGLEMFYRQDGSGNKPERLVSVGVHETVFAERKQAVEDFKQTTGAIDILKGDRPPGVTAASALSMLYEVGTGKLFPVLGRWKKFVESDQKKQLRLIAKNYKEPRPEFIRMLRMKNTELSEQEINDFIGSDLYDNCNVIIEAGSNIPKLQAAEQALLLEVAATGALSLEQPANRSEFLNRLGIIGFDNDVGPDTRRAEWENDLLDDIQQSPDNMPVVLVTDNHEIHNETHARRTKEPSFMSLDISVQKAYFEHMAEHDNYIQEAKQMQAMEAAVTGTPPPEAQPKTTDPTAKISGAGNGVSAKMSDAIFSDAIVPGQAKPTRGPGQAS
jgi:hypothetical protein